MDSYSHTKIHVTKKKKNVSQALSVTADHLDRLCLVAGASLSTIIFLNSARRGPHLMLKLKLIFHLILPAT